MEVFSDFMGFRKEFRELISFSPDNGNWTEAIMNQLEVLKPISGGIAKSEVGHIENTGIHIMQFVHLLHRPDSRGHLRSPLFCPQPLKIRHLHPPKTTHINSQKRIQT